MNRPCRSLSYRLRTSSLPLARPARVLFGIGLGIIVSVAACTERSGPAQPFPEPTGEPTGVVKGMVRSPERIPVSGAFVSLDPISNGRTSTVAAQIEARRAGMDSTAAARVPTDVRTTTSDGDGVFVFGDVTPGTYSLRVMAQSHTGAWDTLTVRRPSLAEAETTFVDIALQPTGNFIGSVFLEGFGSEGGTIVDIEGGPWVAITNDWGLWALLDVPLGTYQIRATNEPLYIPQTMEGTLTEVGETVQLPDITLLRDLNLPPTATASASSSIACFGNGIDFTAVASDVDGVVVRYEWDFDDDGTIDWTFTSPDVSHTYGAAGDYVAKLAVTDDDGAQTIVAVPVSVVDAVHVSASQGDDLDSGTQSRPVATISRGIELASDLGCGLPVKVDNDTYTERVVLETGVDILGGHDVATWTPIGVTTVTSPQVAAEADSVSDVTVRDVHFLAGSAFEPPGWSVAFRGNACATTLVFESCAFTGGAGLSGPSGAPGSPGTPGEDGGDAGPVGPLISPGLGGAVGGGDGGAGSNAGMPGAGAGGGSGGAAGTQGSGTSVSCAKTSDAGDGQPGGPGSSGVDGLNAMGMSPSWSATPTGWLPPVSLDGGAGSTGFGGGGGGGGGSDFLCVVFVCAEDLGGLGGGGGGGGAGGSAGTGATGGGASFGVYLYASDPVFDDCTFTGGTAGDGGVGGDGGAGGVGGSGGAPWTTQASTGGSGGAGGTGGGGGGGMGGAGGWSMGLFNVQASAGALPTINNPTYVVGAAGMGGSGGVHGTTSIPADSGPDGMAGSVFFE